MQESTDSSWDEKQESGLARATEAPNSKVTPGESENVSKLEALFEVACTWVSVTLCAILFSALVLLCFPFALIFDPGRNSLHWLGTRWAMTIVRLNSRWRFEITGKENIPTLARSFVVVSNHKSQADILALFLMDFPFRWLSKHTLFQIPLLGWAMWCVGYVAVNRRDKDSQARCMKESRKHLSEGKSMVFFPEGTRSNDGTMLPFKSGAFRLALDAGVDILPVTLIGTEKLLPKGRLVPQKTHVKIIVHPLISSQGKSLEELKAESRKVIQTALET